MKDSKLIEKMRMWGDGERRIENRSVRGKGGGREMPQALRDTRAINDA